MTPVDPAAFATSVSRLLGKTFVRSTSSGTRVRGYRSHTDGFSCSKAGTYGSPAARVEWVVSSFSDPDRFEERADRMEEVLTKAGYLVSRQVQGSVHTLMVQPVKP